MSRDNGLRRCVTLLISRDEVMGAYFARFGAAAAAHAGCSHIVLSELRVSALLRKVVEEFACGSFIDIRFATCLTLLRRISMFARLGRSVGSGTALCAIQDEGVPIGKHLYDSALRRNGMPRIERLTIRDRIIFILEMAYYLTVRDRIQSLEPDMIILPDITYRQGPIFEWLIKKWRGDMIAGIEMNSLAMHLYQCPIKVYRDCRAPDDGLVERLIDNPKFVEAARRYFDMRSSGADKQHDAALAYGRETKVVTRESLNTEYSLQPAKPLVIVMAHVFSDAPNGLPAFFQDYHEWLVVTCDILGNNREVEFVVKEHPSATLYGEGGLTQEILSKHGWGKRVLRGNINTRSLFPIADLIVTCGGTAGMEFASVGVPVLLGAFAIYSKIGFCIQPTSKLDYCNKLSALTRIEPLDSNKMLKASLALYLFANGYGWDRQSVGFGSQEFRRGTSLDREQFFHELRESLNDTESRNELSKMFSTLLNGPWTNLLRFTIINDSTALPAPGNEIQTH